jgi:hypothetical protein
VCISRSDCAPFRKTFGQLEELLLLVQQAAGIPGTPGVAGGWIGSLDVWKLIVSFSHL